MVFENFEKAGRNWPKNAVSLDKRPGQGWAYLSEDAILIALGFNLTDDVSIVVTGWSPTERRLRIDLQGFAIPWQGGEILSTDPIQTEKQLRDPVVAKEEAMAQAAAMLVEAERLP